MPHHRPTRTKPAPYTVFVCQGCGRIRGGYLKSVKRDDPARVRMERDFLDCLVRDMTPDEFLKGRVCNCAQKTLDAAENP